MSEITLIKFRSRNNITQKEFAELAGVKQQHVAFWEGGMCRYRKKVKEKIIAGIKKYKKTCCTLNH